MSVDPKQVKMSLRSLSLFHTTPSLRSQTTLKLQSSDVIIPPGNWNPCGLANYLNEKLGCGVVSFDPDNLTYHFNPPLELSPGSDEAILNALGFPAGASGSYSNSIQTPILAGPREIQVWTNLGVWNLPQCGLLAAIPITCDYGGLVHYYITTDDAPSIITDHQIRFFEMRLTDENGEPLIVDDALGFSAQIQITESDSNAFAPLFKQ